jgi:hypothetical protein
MLRSLRQLEGTNGFSNREEKLIRHHARLLSCTISRAFFASTKSIEHAESAEETTLFLQQLSSQMKELSTQWLSVKTNFLQCAINQKTRNCLNWTDEAISNQLHLVAQQVLLSVPEGTDGADLLLKWMRRNKKRILKFSPHFLKTSPKYLLRASALKKYTYSALFLKGVAPPEREWLQHLVLGVAAGIAMTWAVLAQVFAFFKLGIDLTQGMNSTLILYFFVIAVITYILKDRIKATTGKYLSKRLAQGATTQETHYHHEEREDIAHAKETVFQVQKNDLPKQILDRWNILDPVPMSMWVGGDFVCYERTFNIYTEAAENTLLNYSGIHDIIRYNVSDWLNSFDDNKRTMVRFSKRGEKRIHEVDRLYEIILSVQLQNDTEEIFKHYRIHISQQGLEKISSISNPFDEQISHNEDRTSAENSSTPIEI